MFHNFRKILERPTLYKETEVAFWDDVHISKQMLKAHLDPEFDGASRRLAFIEKSVKWIKEAIPPQDFPLLLDLGCGAGIYAEKFMQAGFQVTGVDFSKRSIRYAQNSASKKGMDIRYIYQNYLALNLNELFDFITMIYCDYGALSAQNRQVIMENICQHLKPGGKLLLDVFSMSKYHSFLEQQTWEVHHDGGFWRENEYIEINGCYKYSDHVTLEQIAIISSSDAATYYLWNSYFSKETLIKEAIASGFKICEVYGDVAGSPYDKKSLTIAILLEK